MRKTTAIAFTLLALLLVTGCEPRITSVEPASGPGTGLYEITLHGRNFAPDGNEVRVGGILAVGTQRLDAGTIRAIVQGAPVPGPADVTLTNREYPYECKLEGGFTYEPPLHPAFDRMFSLGASLSTGIQSNSLSYFTQTVGPVVQLARQAGAYVGLPLVLFDGVPGVATAGDVHVGHDQEVWDPFLRKMVRVPEGKLYNPAWELGGDLASILVSVLPLFLQNLEFPLAALRLDPSFRDIHNVSVPSAWLTDALLGEKIGLSLFGHIVADPFLPLGKALLTPSPSQILQVVEADPTIIVSLDLYGIDAALLSSEQVNRQAFTSVLFLALLDLATSSFYTTPGAEPGYASIPFIVRNTGRRIQDPFWHHLIDPYGLIVDFETLGFPSKGDTNGNGVVDPREVDLEAVLASDDPSDDPRGVFIANVLNPEFAPSGEGTGNAALAAELNGIFEDLAGRFPNVHVVDVASMFDRLAREARGEAPLDMLDVDRDGRQDLFFGWFGGLFSLDGLHLTETGYALYANQFIRKINETLGCGVPEIDVAAVHARDPLARRNFSEEVLEHAGNPLGR